MPVREPTIVGGTRGMNLRHVGPQTKIWPNPQVRSQTYPLLNWSKVGNQLISRPIPQSMLPGSPDYSDGQYSLRLGDAGDGMINFPNGVASDGVPYRDRFDESGHNEWMEVYKDGALDSVFGILVVQKQQGVIQVTGQDPFFFTKKAFVRDWTTVQAPRDVIERGTRVWLPVIADNFVGGLSNQWSVIQAIGGSVRQGGNGGIVLTVPATGTGTSGSNTNPAGTGFDSSAVGTVPWAQPDGITSVGGAFALATNKVNSAEVTTHYLQATNFGFGIPGSATVVGVLASFSRGASGFVLDNSVKVVKGGTPTGTDKALTGTLWSGSGFTNQVYGSASDLWGTTLTPTDVNSNTFGVAMSVKIGTGGAPMSAGVDFVKLTVYYTVPGGGGGSSSSASGPGSGVDGGHGDISWASPGNITVQDGSYATCSASGGTQTTDLLKATNFGFAIPGGATIVGVAATIQHPSISGVSDSLVKLLVGGSVVGTNQSAGAVWTGTQHTIGSSSSLWGTSLTVAQVNASTFGVAWQAQVAASTTASADFVQIIVWYTTSVSTNSAKGGGAAASVGSFISWTNPSRVLAHDGSNASCGNFGSSASLSDFLQVSNFGFAIPAGATITGVQGTIFTTAAAVTDDDILLTYGGNYIGSNQSAGAAWTTGSHSVGGSSNLWGTGGLTPAQVNDASFGVAWLALIQSHATAQADYIQLTVYYTNPTTSTSTKGCGTGADGGGGNIVWSNPGNITLADGSYATSANTGGGQTSNLLEATAFGFTIPSGSTITGVQATIFNIASGSVSDATAQLLYKGSLIGTNQSAGQNWAATSHSIGGSSSLWGNSSLSLAQVSDPSFGVAWQAAVGAGITASVDFVQFTVFYTAPGSTSEAGLQSQVISLAATSVWTANTTVQTSSLTGFDGVGLTVTESSGDAYALSFFGPAAVSVFQVNGTTVAVLTGDQAVSYNLMIESDGEWVAAYVNGTLVGNSMIRRGNATTTSLQLLVDLASGPFSTQTATATITQVMCRALQPFLQRTSDKGDYVLPGDATTYPVGGLHARYFNNADLTANDGSRLGRIHSPPRTIAYSGSGTPPEYANQQDPQNAAIGPIDGQNPPAGVAPATGPPYSNWSAIWFGSVWLELSKGDYGFELTFPSGANVAVRVWVGQTQLGAQVVEDWDFSSSHVNWLFNVSSDALAGTLPRGGGTIKRDGWYPIKIEYAVDAIAASAPTLLITNSPATYTDPGGTVIAAGAQSTVLPATSCSPLGCVDQRFQGVSHYDLVQQTATAVDYQFTVEYARLESGAFPGVLAPRLREGYDTDAILTPDLSPRSEALFNYGSTEDASDFAADLFGNGAGLNNGNTGQLQANVYDPTTLFDSFFDVQAWQDFSDASYGSLLEALLNSRLGLQKTSWQAVIGDPLGKERLAQSTPMFPLPQSLWGMRYQPGDGLRLRARDVSLWDEAPRQLLTIQRAFVPMGVVSSSVGWANRPRGVTRAHRELFRSTTRLQRAKQRYPVSLSGTYRKNIYLQAGASSAYESVVSLQPGDVILSATLRVNENPSGLAYGILVNEAEVTNGLNGPWSLAPMVLNLFANAQPDSTNQISVTLKNVGAKGGRFSWQLLVDVLR